MRQVSVTLNFLRKLWKYPPKTCFTNILKISCFLQFLLIDVHIFKHPTGAPRSHFLSKANKFLLSFNICVVSFCLCLHFLPNISSILWNSWAFVRRYTKLLPATTLARNGTFFPIQILKKNGWFHEFFFSFNLKSNDVISPIPKAIKSGDVIHRKWFYCYILDDREKNV